MNSNVSPKKCKILIRNIQGQQQIKDVKSTCNWHDFKVLFHGLLEIVRKGEVCITSRKPFWRSVVYGHVILMNFLITMVEFKLFNYLEYFCIQRVPPFTMSAYLSSSSHLQHDIQSKISGTITCNEYFMSIFNVSENGNDRAHWTLLVLYNVYSCNRPVVTDDNYRVYALSIVRTSSMYMSCNCGILSVFTNCKQSLNVLIIAHFVDCNKTTNSYKLDQKNIYKSEFWPI